MSLPSVSLSAPTAPSAADPVTTACRGASRAAPHGGLRMGFLFVLAVLTACNGDGRSLGDPANPQPPAGPPPPGSPGPTLPPDYMPPTCSKVDILFVIDDSGSMADNQQSLIRSFPGFIDGMRRKLAGALDYHVGVVTSDDYGGNAAGCRKIGSLVTRTGGPKSSQKDCGPFAGPAGRRYLTSDDTDLKERFACIAQVGAGGADDERMARGLLNAIAPTAAAKGACNEGFLRPDSLLVVVVISDEDDVPDGCDGMTCATNGSGGTPDDWFAEFKKHRPLTENVVVLSLIGRRANNPCGAVPASRLMRFTNFFGAHGYLGDVCAPSYDSFFESALPLISSVCSSIPG